MKYKAMIFDLDGTLLNSKKDIANATNATLQMMSCPLLADELIYTYVGRGVRDLIRSALCDHDELKIDKALKYFNEYYLEHCVDESHNFEGVNETLIKLKDQGIKLSVFTNKPQNFTDKIFSQMGIVNWFDMVLGAENGYPHKPDKTGTQAILKSLQADAQDTLFVGDSIVDLQTAENANVDCALMLYGFSPREEMLALSHRAKFVFERFEELLKLI